MNIHVRPSLPAWDDDGRALYYGPFHSRNAAEKFVNDSLDFFKMRRCVNDLHPDPKFPGCIYSEMKMCLAPCFKGCTDEEYSAEVNRVQAYFDSGGESLAREFSVQRDAASANLAFEDAAAIHVRLEKLKAILNQAPEIVRRLDRLSALIVQPCQQPDSVTFFRVQNGTISGPASLLHPTRRAREIAIHGIACAGRSTIHFRPLTHIPRSKPWSISPCSSAGTIAGAAPTKYF